MTAYSYDQLAQEIREKSYAIIPFPLMDADFRKSIDAYLAFLALPYPEKEPIYFNIDLGDGRGGDVGYRKYRREEGKIDNREFFHYHPDAETHFVDARERLAPLHQLLVEMKRIHTEATSAMNDILAAFDTQFPGIHGLFFPTNRVPNFTLRFLKYDCGKPGEFLATGHYDRGGCTLALAESAPGLRIGIDDVHLQDVVHDEGRALFMPALNFPLFTNGTIRPAWHDVVQKGEDTYSTDIARWAIVFFADTYVKPITTFEDRHTPQRLTA